MNFPDDGILISFNDTQSSKVASLITINVGERNTFDKEGHLEKVNLPIFTTEDDIAIFLNDEHPVKDPSLIDYTDSGIDISLNELHLAKQYFPIFVILYI